MKICRFCKQQFEEKIHNQVYCSFKCRNKFHNSKEISKQRDIKFRKSKKRKEWLKNYYKTKKYKKSLTKIKSNPEYKHKRKVNYKKYNKSEKGRLSSLRNDSKRKHNLKRLKQTFTHKELKENLLETNGLCSICKKYVGMNKLALDHIIPISKADDGQVYTINDIQFVCKSCNSKKGVKLE